MSTFTTSKCKPATATRRWLSSRAWLVALLAAVSCGGRAPAANGAQKASAASTKASCAGAGPLHCDVLPAKDPSEICAQIEACLLNRKRGDEYGVLTKVSECTAPLNVVDAPPGSDVSALGFVTLSGELDEREAEGTFLFARDAAGYCLIDSILPLSWIDFGHFENELSSEWQGAALHVQAQRLARVPVDQSISEEEAEGADVQSVECNRAVYTLGAGTLTRSGESSVDTLCPAE